MTVLKYNFTNIFHYLEKDDILLLRGMNNFNDCIQTLSFTTSP